MIEHPDPTASSGSRSREA